MGSVALEWYPTVIRLTFPTGLFRHAVETDRGFDSSLGIDSCSLFLSISEYEEADDTEVKREERGSIEAGAAWSEATKYKHLAARQTAAMAGQQACNRREGRR